MFGPVRSSRFFRGDDCSGNLDFISKSSLLHATSIVVFLVIVISFLPKAGVIFTLVNFTGVFIAFADLNESCFSGLKENKKTQRLINKFIERKIT